MRWVLRSGARWSDLPPRYATAPTKACISGLRAGPPRACGNRSSRP
ncbi:hypothetical protein [Xanthomonas graminis]